MELGTESAQMMVESWKNLVPMCVVHRFEEAVAHCYSCNTPVCQSCMAAHTSHECERLTVEVTERYRSQLGQSAADMLKNVESSRVTNRCLQDRRSTKMLDMAQVEKEIREKEEEIEKLVIVKSHYEISIASLENALRESAFSVDLSQKIIRFLKELETKGSNSDVMSLFKLVSDRVEKIIQIPDSVDGAQSRDLIALADTNSSNAGCSGSISKEIIPGTFIQDLFYFYAVKICCNFGPT
jgi:hypothetical protein